MFYCFIAVYMVSIDLMHVKTNMVEPITLVDAKGGKGEGDRQSIFREASGETNFDDLLLKTRTFLSLIFLLPR